MKFHRVLLFTSIQMDITPVGDDLHVLLTCGGENRLDVPHFPHRFQTLTPSNAKHLSLQM